MAKREKCKEYGQWDACLTCPHKECIVGGHNALTGLYPKGFKPHVRPAKQRAPKHISERKSANSAEYFAQSVKSAEEHRADDLRFVEEIFGIGG